MACRFMDGFDYYSTTDITRKWSSKGNNATIVSTPIRNGTGALSLDGSSTQGFVTINLDNQASWVIGFGFRFDAFNTTNTFINIKDDAVVQCSIALHTDGTLEVFRGTASAVTDGRSTLTLNADRWYYIEWKFTISDSIAADSCIVNVDEVEYINVASGQDIKSSANATSNTFALKANNTGPFHFFDDVYIFDTSGSDNVDFAGDSKVLPHYADGNGATSNFTGSDADSTDNYLHVDETDTDDDITYVESSGVGDIDLYTFDNFVDTPNTIHAIQINMVTKKDDAGSRTIRSIVRPVSTDIEGDTKSPSDGSYSNEMQIYDLNPEVTGVWTETTFNATEFGIKIQA